MQLTFLHGVHQVSQPGGMEDGDVTYLWIRWWYLVARSCCCHPLRQVRISGNSRGLRKMQNACSLKISNVLSRHILEQVVVKPCRRGVGCGRGAEHIHLVHALSINVQRIST